MKASPAQFTVTSKAVGASVLASGLLLIVAPEAAHSFTVYTFRTNPRETTITRDFVEGGITLTVNNAQGNNILTAPSNAHALGGFGGVNTDINNGLCVALYAGFEGKCQYTASTPGDPTLTGLTFSFNKPVELKSFEVFRAGGVEAGVIAFTVGSSSQTFNFSNPGGAASPNGVSVASFDFAPNFAVNAFAPLTVSTVGTKFSENQSGSFRISNFKVQEVPGPLPLLGFAAAFGWSRKLRKKLGR